jgi:hypothetical protein
MKVERRDDREFILQFDSVEEFEIFFKTAEDKGHFVLPESGEGLSSDSIFLARAQGSPRTRKIKPLEISNTNGRCCIHLRREASTEQAAEKEPVKEDKPRSLHEKIRSMGLTERAALAMKADLHERRILMQENNLKIHEFLLRNPRITESEIAWMARNATSPIQTILAIFQNKAWMAIDSIRAGILLNPKTPPAIVMDMIPLLSAAELIRMFNSPLLREDVHAAVEREAKKRRLNIRPPKE